MLEMINVGDNQVGDRPTTMPEGTALADSMRRLLTTMKLFGMYFGCRSNMGDRSTTKKSRVQWNLYLVYAVVVVIFLWINVFRMFSVFTETFC